MDKVLNTHVRFLLEFSRYCLQIDVYMTRLFVFSQLVYSINRLDVDLQELANLQSFLADKKLVMKPEVSSTTPGKKQFSCKSSKTLEFSIFELIYILKYC